MKQILVSDLSPGKRSPATRIPGPAYLWFSVLVFGAASSIVRILSDLGAQHPIDGRNAISFCNLLFAGNACAAAVLYAVHRKEWTVRKLRLLTKSDWAGLLAVALLANGIAPWLFFLAIENTMVTNVVLVSQIEPPLLLALSWLIFRDRIGPWTIVGATICLVGIALSVLLQPMTGEIRFGKGEIFASLAAVTYAISAIITRRRLRHIPLGIFSVFRCAVGTVAFFIVVSYLFGPMHFIDLTSPFLWQWMVVYGGIIIVSGQFAWDTGIRKSQSIDVSLATSFAPIAGVLGAFLILGEQPSAAHYMGGAVLMLGIMICLADRRTKARKESPKSAVPSEEVSSALEAECRAGFKGV